MNLEKRRYNNHTIQHLYKSDGDLTSSNEEVLAEMDKHFGKLYCPTGDESRLEDLNIDMELIPQVPEECQQLLESLVTMEELNSAIKTMQTGKAPGCDGFGLGFYTTFWMELQRPMLNMIHHSSKTKRLPTSLRDIMLMLLPKHSEQLHTLNAFRGLSLLTVDYWIISKIVAKKIQPSLDYIIHSSQVGFMKERYIGTNITCIYDIVEYAEKYQLQCALLSLDIQKAFDVAKWSAVQYAMRLFGFKQNIRQWVDILYTDMRFTSLNANWTSTWQTPTQGLFQGSCAAPTLFLILMELLSIMLRANASQIGVKVAQKFLVGRFFADDGILILQGNQSAFAHTIDILDNFAKFSGLFLNYDKCKVTQIGALRDSEARFYLQRQLQWSDGTFTLLGVDIDVNDLHSDMHYYCILIKM